MFVVEDVPECFEEFGAGGGTAELLQVDVEEKFVEIDPVELKFCCLAAN